MNPFDLKMFTLKLLTDRLHANTFSLAATVKILAVKGCKKIFQINLDSQVFLRLELHWTNCVDTFYVSFQLFYIFKQVPIDSS